MGKFSSKLRSNDFLSNVDNLIESKIQLEDAFNVYGNRMDHDSRVKLEKNYYNHDNISYIREVLDNRAYRDTCKKQYDTFVNAVKNVGYDPATISDYSDSDDYEF